MSAHDPQPFELAAFKCFKELQTDCQDSDLPLFLDNFKRELAEMKAYMEANSSDERTAFEAVFCESTNEQASPEPCNRIPLPELPPLATVKELKAQQPPEFLKADGWFDIDVSKFYMDFTEAWQPPEYTLSYKGVMFAPLQGVCGISGQSGNGKTQLICQLIATILSGQFGELKCELSGRPKVLYCDTEQERANSVAAKNRILELAGRNQQQPQDDFVVIMLREVTSVEDRWRMVLKALYEQRPQVAFLDGGLDLIDNFNDNEKCMQFLYKLMAAASFYHCCIWVVVHMNPSQTPTKMIGHLGSFLERKASDIFSTTKQINDKTGEISFVVKQLKARSRDVESWKFRVLPVSQWGRPEMISDTPVDDEIPIENIEAWLRTDKGNIEQPATLEAYKDIFRQRGHVKASDTLQRCVERAKNKRLIIPQDKSEYAQGQKHPKYYLNL